METSETHTANGEVARADSDKSAATTNNQNISENAFQRVRDLIVHGRLAPGSRLIEADLADKLGVSRTPIRTALHRLRQEGYIIVMSDSGNKARLAVAPLTQDDAQDLYRVIGCLEGLAARSSAQLGSEARNALAAKLREYNKGLQELAEQHRADPNLTFDLDMNFHEAIIEAGAGPRLRTIHAAIKPQTERYWRLYASAIIDQLGISVDEHLAIISSIEKGDYEAAERAMQVNWQMGSERLSRVIATLGERGSW